MSKYKIYKIITNNGNWGGCNNHYTIAKNEEEALNNIDAQKYEKKGYEVWDPVCLDNPEDILHAIGVYNTDGYDIDISINITKKEDSCG